MKILQVLPTMDSTYGGPVRVAKAMKTGLETLHHHVEMFPLPSELDASMPNHRGFLFWPGINALKRLAELIKWADLVHIHGLWTLPTSLAASLAFLYKKPYVMTPHGMLDKWSLQRSRLKKELFAFVWERRNLIRSNALHFLNYDEWGEAPDYVSGHPAFVIPNGIDISGFQDLPGRVELREMYPQTRNSIVILFLSRIHIKKGLDILVPALKEALGQGLDLHLIIAGPDEGGYRSRVRHLITQAGIGDAVTFAGEVDGIRKKTLLGGSDFFILPSYQEGDSVAVKEALAAGLPVLITHACHLKEVEERQAGIVCDNDLKQVSAGLFLLGSNPLLRQVMSANAKRMIAENYRSDVLLGELNKVYMDVILNKQDSKCWVKYDLPKQSYRV